MRSQNGNHMWLDTARGSWISWTWGRGGRLMAAKAYLAAGVQLVFLDDVEDIG